MPDHQAMVHERSNDSIVLVGMMGTGKTTVGKLLAKKLKYTFYDSDTVIVSEEKESIQSIFAEHGEAYFREKEKIVISGILQDKEKFVLSTGGGSILDSDTRTLLKQKKLVVWLYADPKTLARRVSRNLTNTGASSRPLLDQNPFEKLVQLTKARNNFYDEVSRIRIDVGACTPTQVVDRIVSSMGQP